MRRQGYTSDSSLPEVWAVNCEFTERQKEQKDAEKRRRESKRKEKEEWEKENRAWEKEGKSSIPSPDSTLEPESTSLAGGEVDYSMLPELDTEEAGG